MAGLKPLVCLIITALGINGSCAAQAPNTATQAPIPTFPRALARGKGCTARSPDVARVYGTFPQLCWGKAGMGAGDAHHRHTLDSIKKREQRLALTCRQPREPLPRPGRLTPVP